MQQLINYINNFAILDDEAIAELKLRAEKEYFLKNQAILQPGEYCNKIWFIKSGMVRKYHIVDGKEITLWIHTENEFFTSLQSYAQHKTSDEYLVACENTKLISISKQNSEKLARFHQFVTFSNALMEKEVVNIDIHSKAFNSKDAKGRYEYLQSIAPEIIKRAKLGHIASLIGVTQETLSRIRKTI